MLRSTLFAAFVLVAVSCSQGSSSSTAPEVKAHKSALEQPSSDSPELKWPELRSTGFKPVTLERSGEQFVPVQPMPKEGAAKPAEVKLPTSAGAPFEVRLGRVAIRVKLLGQQPVPGVLKDDVVLFPGAREGDDVTMRALSGGVEDFVALDGTKPPSVQYDVEL
jgi:hypothetical protein